MIFVSEPTFLHLLFQCALTIGVFWADILLSVFEDGVQNLFTIFSTLQPKILFIIYKPSVYELILPSNTTKTLTEDSRHH